MFLTKKTAAPKQQKKNNKALGGWDDEDISQAPNQSKSNYSKFNEIQSTIQKNQINRKPKTTGQIDLLNETNSNYQGVSFQPVQVKNQFVKKPQETKNKKIINQSQMFYDAPALQQMSNIQCQCKAIQTVLSPGGIRIKQSDSILSQFLNQAKNLEIPIIGSLLICYLYNESVDFQVKARSLYAIQHLAKKSIQYSVYFKLHIERIKNSPTCAQQQDSYKKIKKNLLVTLGDTIMKPEERKQVQQQLKKKQGLQYSDPGYGGEPNLLGMINNEKEKGTKKLVSPAEVKGKQKKVLTGPGGKKTENRASKQMTKVDKIDLLEIEQDIKNKETQIDLLSGGNDVVQNQKQRNFDDLFRLQQEKKEGNDLNIFF